ncbi:MAG: methyltransferase domain-containing protein [Anaerolineae bacterium]|nr:methyltransferase domain-containing protein [Anaerolineae bacterium]
MTDHYEEIYNEEAVRYEALVSHEDYQERLPAALQAILPTAGLDIVDLGAGTGRLACLLAPTARSMTALDLSPHMLAITRDRLRASGLRNWTAAVADHRALPLNDNTADLAISGWSIVYTVVWYPDVWQRELNRALDEMARVVRPGGALLILETMGTGFTTPSPPEDLLDYFTFLDGAGFASTWIRTDYRFADREEARERVTFFFGEAMLEKCEGEGPVILPECTGLWWKTT